MDLLIWVIIFLISAILILIFAFCKLAGQLDEQDLTNEMSLKKLEQAQAYSAELLRNNVKLTGQLQAEQKRADDYKEKAEILQAAHERLVTVPVYDLDELTEEAEQEQTEICLLPAGIDTNTFRCEPYQVKIRDEDGNITGYKSAFHPKSDQYRLQQECKTDRKGIRYYTDSEGNTYACAAMATAYGIEIGTAYEVTLQCGTVLNVIMGDFKHPIYSPSADDYGDADINYDREHTISVLEFIVDMDLLLDDVKRAGTMSVLSEFGGLYGDGGNIVKIEYLGRKWVP